MRGVDEHLNRGVEGDSRPDQQHIMFCLSSPPAICSTVVPSPDSICLTALTSAPASTSNSAAFRTLQRSQA
jgi:hypothetical protein